MNYFPKNITPFLASASMWRYTRNFTLLFITFFLLEIQNVKASHYAGGEINYECLGNNQYRINLILYRDCIGAGFASQEYINITSASCGITLSTITLGLDTTYEVSQNCSSVLTACNGGTNPGFERYQYTGVVTFPQACTDWIVSWSSCCRNAQITNLGLNQASIYIESGINNTVCTSSPVFTTRGIPYFCAGHCYEYNAGAYAPNGDSLIYSLTCPLQGANSCIPSFIGYQATQPVATSPSNSFVLNPNTGQMSFCPVAGQWQTSVVAMTVYQISNGDTVGYVQREMQFIVLNSPTCTVPATSTTPANIVGGTFDSLNQVFEVCGGQTLNFETIVYDSEGLAIDIDSFNTNLDIIVGVGNWSITFDTIAPYRPDSARVSVQIITTNQFVGTNTFTLSFTDNVCPVQGITTIGYGIKIIGVEATFANTGTSRMSICPGIALDIPLKTKTNAQMAGTYGWTQVAGPMITFSSDTIPNPTLFVPNTTQSGDTIIIRVTQTTGACVSIDELTLYTEVQALNLNVLATDSVLCPNGQADTIHFLTTVGNSTINTAYGNYTWTTNPVIFASNLTSTTINAPSTVLNPAIGDTIVYQVKYDYGLCSDSVEITLRTRLGSVLASTALDTVCVGDSVQLMAVLTDTILIVDSTSCYTYTVNSIPFTPVLGSGMAVSLGDEEVSGSLPIGFDFEFYCNTYNEFRISSNGFITFNAVDTTAYGCCAGQVLPNSLRPNDLIALCWEDLSPNTGGTIEYFTTGVAPNRQLVVNFINVPRFGGGITVTVQAVLHEGTNWIDINTTSIFGTLTDITTQGIENSTGTIALTVAGRNGVGGWSASNDAYRFMPGSGYKLPSITYNWTPSNHVSDATLYDPIGTPIQTTTYVASINENGCVQTDSVTVAVASTLNAPVLTCGLAPVPSSSVLFNWGQVAGATGWEYSLDSGATWIVRSLSDSTYLFTGLQQGTCYGIWVRAIGGTGICSENAATYLECCTNILSNAVTQNGITLSAVEFGPSISYQWIDCNNGNALISGETGRSFTPLANGDYAVHIEDGVNIVTSTCNNVNVSATSRLENELGIHCYPNPTTGIVTIQGKDTEKLDVEVLDPLGRLVLSQTVNSAKIELDLSGYPVGVYMLQVKSGNQRMSQKIIKK